MAEKNPVGKARDNPNHSPTLPQPEGRITLSLNPFDMYKQLIGPEVRAKICRWLIVIICLALCVSIGPTFLGSLLSGFAVKITNGVQTGAVVNPTMYGSARYRTQKANDYNSYTMNSGTNDDFAGDF